MTTFEFQFEKTADKIPFFVITYKNDNSIITSGVIVISIADAFKILENYKNNVLVAVFDGGYNNPAAICWYPEHDSDRRAIISSGSDGDRGVYATDEQVEQLINELRQYVRYCATIV